MDDREVKMRGYLTPQCECGAPPQRDGGRATVITVTKADFVSRGERKQHEFVPLPRWFATAQASLEKLQRPGSRVTAARPWRVAQLQWPSGRVAAGRAATGSVAVGYFTRT